MNGLEEEKNDSGISEEFLKKCVQKMFFEIDKDGDKL
jgi:hypothetical protein